MLVYSLQCVCVKTDLVDVSFQDVMSQLQNLLLAQFPLLSAEPEGQESVSTPWDRETDISISFQIIFCMSPSKIFHNHTTARQKRNK